MTEQEFIKKAAERTDAKIRKIVKHCGDENGERLTLYYFVAVLDDEIKSMMLEQQCCKKIENQRQQKNG